MSQFSGLFSLENTITALLGNGGGVAACKVPRDKWVLGVARQGDGDPTEELGPG